jgi:hypothetical protein
MQGGNYRVTWFQFDWAQKFITAGSNGTSLTLWNPRKESFRISSAALLNSCWPSTKHSIEYLISEYSANFTQLVATTTVKTF